MSNYLVKELAPLCHIFVCLCHSLIWCCVTFVPVCKSPMQDSHPTVILLRLFLWECHLAWPFLIICTSQASKEHGWGDLCSVRSPKDLNRVIWCHWVEFRNHHSRSSKHPTSCPSSLCLQAWRTLCLLLELTLGTLMSALFLVGTHPDSSRVSSAGLLDSDCCQGLTGGLEHEARCGLCWWWQTIRRPRQSMPPTRALRPVRN